MPGVGASSEGHFYSYNVGAAHIVVYSTEFYYFVGYGWEQIERQYQWLRRDLEDANRPENRARRPWIIGVLRCARDVYCSSATDIRKLT